MHNSCIPESEMPSLTKLIQYHSRRVPLHMREDIKQELWIQACLAARSGWDGSVRLATYIKPRFAHRAFVLQQQYVPGVVIPMGKMSEYLPKHCVLPEEHLFDQSAPPDISLHVAVQKAVETLPEEHKRRHLMYKFSAVDGVKRKPCRQLKTYEGPVRDHFARVLGACRVEY